MEDKRKQIEVNEAQRVLVRIKEVESLLLGAINNIKAKFLAIDTLGGDCTRGSHATAPDAQEASEEVLAPLGQDDALREAREG